MSKNKESAITYLGVEDCDIVDRCNCIFRDNYADLCRLARLAHDKYGLKSNQVIIYCIKVDTEWRDMVELIMPNFNWQQIRNQGLEPMARGVEKFSICTKIAEKMPQLKEELEAKPTEDYFKCIVLDEGGGTIYKIEVEGG
jgi:hypothetical protein